MNHKQALVVDAEPIVALDLKRCLETLRYGVAIETTGARRSGNRGPVEAGYYIDGCPAGRPHRWDQAAEQIRREFRGPLIFLTASADHQTMERAAQVEPSGYIVKPLPERNLAAATCLAFYSARKPRRTVADDAVPPGQGRPRSSVIDIGGLRIDFMQRSVWRRGTTIWRTKKEIDILQCLAEHSGAPVSPEVILNQSVGSAICTLRPRVHVGNLRNKIEDDSSGIRIEGLRGVGYRLVHGNSLGSDRHNAFIEK